MKKVLFILFALLIATSTPVCATSRTADSCSYDDVKAKYDLSSAGDTIVIPACNDGSTWSTGLAVTIPITIQGNGSTGGSKTKLIAHSTLNTGIIQINVTSTSLVRVSGIYFDLVTSANSDRFAIKVQGSITQLQIDNNYFYGGKYQIYKTGTIYGVIHQNTFHNANASLELDGDNDTSWGLDVKAGMDIGLNTLYIEGNTFLRDSSLECQVLNYHFESSQGGTFVARYNTFDGSTYCAAGTDSDYGIMTHGNGACYSVSVMRGHPITEVYNNYLTMGRVDGVWVFRGGSILVHDNTVTTSITASPKVQLVEEEVRNDVFLACPKTAWPAEDQIYNSFIWSNTQNGSAMSVSVSYNNANCTASENPYVCCTGSGTGTCDTIIVENQDYFAHAPQSSGGKETLYNNGTTKFTYYDATHKMTFSSSGANAYYPYTPYTCPHPLTGMTGTCKSTGTAGATDYADNLLTVAKDGTGSGTVASDVGSISCGDTCTWYYGGQEVTLTATALGGSTFAGWAGDCSGAGTGVVTVSAAKTCTATFNISGGGTTGSMATGTTGSVGLSASGTGSITIVP